MIGFNSGNDPSFNNDTVLNCYSVGKVIGTSRYGGLVGWTQNSVVHSNCFWDTITSGLSISDGGIGKSTAEMYTQTIYTSSTWDFVGETTNGLEDIWEMGLCSSGGYPVFNYQSISATPIIIYAKDGNICDSGIVNLFASGSSGIINWYDSDTTVTLLDTGSTYETPYLTSSTTYWAEAVDTNGCTSLRTDVTAIVNNYHPDSSVIIEGNLLIAKEDSIGVLYQWLDCDQGNTPVNGATKQNFSPGNDGTFAVELTLNGCSSRSDCMYFSFVGVENSAKLDFKIYPNPNDGEFTIELKERNQSYEVIDMTGRVIQGGNLNAIFNKINIGFDFKGTLLLKVNDQMVRLVSI